MNEGPTWLTFAAFAVVHAGVMGGWLLRMGKHEQSLKERLKSVEARLDKGGEKLDHLLEGQAELRGYLKGLDEGRSQ